MTGQPLAIDLFCGLGGWTDGLLAVGWRVVGYDIEAHEYGDQRYKGELVIQDVLTLHGSQFKDADLIVASPPCQEYSYMAMPWKLAKSKAAAIRADTTGAELERLNRLFNACFRIQKEASVAAGRHIPLIVENVRGAIPWVGRNRYNFGSFYLWGDVPALMPAAARGALKHGVAHRSGGATNFHRDLNNGVKAPGMNWSDPSKRGQDFTRLAGKHAAEGQKNVTGGSWFGLNPDGSPGALNNARDAMGTKQAGLSGARENGKGDRWFQDGAARSGSKSTARKAASAMIAKIPEPLSYHIARTFLPRQAQHENPPPPRKGHKHE